MADIKQWKINHSITSNSLTGTHSFLIQGDSDVEVKTIDIDNLITYFNEHLNISSNNNSNGNSVMYPSGILVGNGTSTLSVTNADSIVKTAFGYDGINTTKLSIAYFQNFNNAGISLFTIDQNDVDATGKMLIVRLDDQAITPHPILDLANIPTGNGGSGWNLPTNKTGFLYNNAGNDDYYSIEDLRRYLIFESPKGVSINGTITKGEYYIYGLHYDTTIDESLTFKRFIIKNTYNSSDPNDVLLTKGAIEAYGSTISSSSTGLSGSGYVKMNGTTVNYKEPYQVFEDCLIDKVSHDYAVSEQRALYYGYTTDNSGTIVGNIGVLQFSNTDSGKVIGINGGTGNLELVDPVKEIKNLNDGIVKIVSHGLSITNETNITRTGLKGIKSPSSTLNGSLFYTYNLDGNVTVETLDFSNSNGNQYIRVNNSGQLELASINTGTGGTVLDGNGYVKMNGTTPNYMSADKIIDEGFGITSTKYPESNETGICLINGEASYNQVTPTFFKITKNDNGKILRISSTGTEDPPTFEIVNAPTGNISGYVKGDGNGGYSGVDSKAILDENFGSRAFASNSFSILYKDSNGFLSATYTLPTDNTPKLVQYQYNSASNSFTTELIDVPSGSGDALPSGVNGQMLVNINGAWESKQIAITDLTSSNELNKFKIIGIDTAYTSYIKTVNIITRTEEPNSDLGDSFEIPGKLYAQYKYDWIEGARIGNLSGIEDTSHTTFNLFNDYGNGMILLKNLQAQHLHTAVIIFPIYCNYEDTSNNIIIDVTLKRYVEDYQYNPSAITFSDNVYTFSQIQIPITTTEKAYRVYEQSINKLLNTVYSGNAFYLYDLEFSITTSNTTTPVDITIPWVRVSLQFD